MTRFNNSFFKVIVSLATILDTRPSTVEGLQEMISDLRVGIILLLGTTMLYAKNVIFFITLQKFAKVVRQISSTRTRSLKKRTKLRRLLWFGERKITKS